MQDRVIYLGDGIKSGTRDPSCLLLLRGKPIVGAEEMWLRAPGDPWVVESEG